MLNVNIKTINHAEHRYSTVGDYWEEHGKRYVRVSELNNTDLEFLISIHEQIEQHLCLNREISEDGIMKWDIDFREDGEPGEDKCAPYHKEHVFAENIERLIAQELGINWNEYCQKLESLYEKI